MGNSQSNASPSSSPKHVHYPSGTGSPIRRTSHSSRSPRTSLASRGPSASPSSLRRDISGDSALGAGADGQGSRAEGKLWPSFARRGSDQASGSLKGSPVGPASAGSNGRGRAGSLAGLGLALGSRLAPAPTESHSAPQTPAPSERTSVSSSPAVTTSGGTTGVKPHRPLYVRKKSLELPDLHPGRLAPLAQAQPTPPSRHPVADHSYSSHEPGSKRRPPGNLGPLPRMMVGSGWEPKVASAPFSAGTVEGSAAAGGGHGRRGSPRASPRVRHAHLLPGDDDLASSFISTSSGSIDHSGAQELNGIRTPPSSTAPGKAYISLNAGLLDAPPAAPVSGVGASHIASSIPPVGGGEEGSLGLSLPPPAVAITSGNQSMATTGPASSRSSSTVPAGQAASGGLSLPPGLPAAATLDNTHAVGTSSLTVSSSHPGTPRARTTSAGGASPLKPRDSSLAGATNGADHYRSAAEAWLTREHVSALPSGETVPSGAGATDALEAVAAGGVGAGAGACVGVSGLRSAPPVPGPGTSWMAGAGGEASAHGMSIADRAQGAARKVREMARLSRLSRAVVAGVSGSTSEPSTPTIGAVGGPGPNLSPASARRRLHPLALVTEPGGGGIGATEDTMTLGGSAPATPRELVGLGPSPTFTDTGEEGAKEERERQLLSEAHQPAEAGVMYAAVAASSGVSDMAGSGASSSARTVRPLSSPALTPIPSQPAATAGPSDDGAPVTRQPLPQPQKAAAAAAATTKTTTTSSAAARARSTPLTPVLVSWRGNKGEKSVSVTGTWARGWEGRVKMEKSTHDFTVLLNLPPGTHRLKFIVDGQWRVSNELSTATDGDGNLVNYIEITDDASGWTGDGDGQLAGGRGRRRAAGPGAGGGGGDQDGDGWRKKGDGLEDVFGKDNRRLPPEESEWTSEIPPALIFAQELEEAIRARATTATSPSPSSPPRTPTSPRSSRPRSRGNPHGRSPNPASSQPSPSPPAASSLLPNPPALPRQLERVILNHSPANPSLAPPGGTVDDNSILPVPNHVVLNHLTASAIKNGVLAVGSTTRYKRKYVTTVFYRPVQS